MSSVSVYTEWDPLEEIIVGTAIGARIPIPGRDLFTVEYADYRSSEDIPSGPFPRNILDETEEELCLLQEQLVGSGVKVRRPEPRDLSATTVTQDWTTDGFYDYCPRDGFLVVGESIIETPMVLRSRSYESLAYKDLFLEYFVGGAQWLSAPKPRLLDELYDSTAPPGRRLRNIEIAFDAANVLRFGTDLLYLVSDSGNDLGAQWLQSTLGEEYTVHRARNLYASTHVDSTLVPLRPGLLLVNPSRVNDENIPEFLRSWTRIQCPEPVDMGFWGANPYCSVWIGMNVLVVAPGVVIADRRQNDLLRVLDHYGVDVIPMQLTHARTLGGGFHCATLDVRRRGTLETYT